MSALTKLSVFFYGTTVTKNNFSINFDEGSGELTAYVRIADYTLEQYAEAIADAMTITGTQTYTATVNRTNRKITISSVAPFDLLSNSGSQTSIGIWTMAGFSTATDYTGNNSYIGNVGAGSEYRPQLIFDKYIALEDFEIKESAVVNQSASGVVQTLQYGDGQRMQCNIRGATEVTGTKNDTFYENANGIADLRSFLRYLITKAKIEFMPDNDVRTTFYNLILDNTDKSSNGTAFTIKNMDGANNYFESGLLTFRKVIE